jgi:HB1/ASXL restriction endonuclease-like protein with HTH domain
MTFVDELLARHRQLTSEVEEEAARAQQLLAEVEKKRQALEALEKLIRIEGAALPDEPRSLVAFPPTVRVSSPISDAAYEVLQERGMPVYYQELARELQLRGVVIGGQTPANTMLAHLSRDDRFYRPARGTYALREWNPKARNVGARRKKGA